MVRFFHYVWGLLVGDLGFSVVENFKEKYPKQFINAGVAEQNMALVSAGMALTGKKIFTETIIFSARKALFFGFYE